VKDTAVAAATRAAEREYTFDEIAFVTLNVAQKKASGALSSPVRLERLPVKFAMHFDEDDYMSDKEGYQTSTLVCDSLLSLPAGNYVVTSYEALDSSKKLLESNYRPSENQFTIEDNITTDVDIVLAVDMNAEYIKDYYALYEIWKALDGENWYYDGEEWERGTNWDFNKDVDLWATSQVCNFTLMAVWLVSILAVSVSEAICLPHWAN
jgi:hypothetical protein